jgi:hypothetical protein
MTTYVNSMRSRVTTGIALLLMLIGTSCAPAKALPTPTPAIQTVAVTREVTREITREVTYIVEIPVTVTPTLTPVYTYTPSLTPTLTVPPTITPTPDPPVVTVLVHSQCLFGPGSAYLYKYGLLETSRMEVIGRNLDGSWLYVQGVHGWNPCWVKATLVKFNTGSVQDVPIVWAELPYSNLYRPPQAVSANRVGNEVTIFWQPVWMTEDDYRGYLIEAWVCQGGQQVFLPIGYVTSFDQNSSMIAVKVTDEPGCLVPSSARIYAAEKHGYSGYRMIPWPAYGPTAAGTPTPTPTSTP